MRDSFTTLKAHLLKAPILAYPDFESDEPFIFDTDWCGDTNSIGATLSQVQRGKERTILYAAHKLAASQASYNATKGELVAIVFFVNHLRYILQHWRFLVRTDHQPLVHLRSMQPPDAVTRRWLQLLSNYDFEIMYRPGPKHGNADALSRAPHVESRTEALTECGTDEGKDARGIASL